MSLYNGPPRAGARGGRDQFSWDNVKVGGGRDATGGMVPRDGDRSSGGRWDRAWEQHATQAGRASVCASLKGRGGPKRLARLGVW